MMRRMSLATMRASFLLFLLFETIFVARAAIPNAEIRLHNSQLYLGVYGAFGTRVRVDEAVLVMAPEDNDLLCDDNVTNTDDSNNSNNIFVLLVPRGECNFTTKAHRAQHVYGAAGILIYNRLEARYGWNNTTSRVMYPQARTDYECNNGRDDSIIAGFELELDPPRYATEFHDPLLTLSSPTNICQLDDASRCDSQRCLVTEPDENDNSTFTACCAWDIPFEMGDSPSDGPVSIPSISLTMQQGSDLVGMVMEEEVVMVSLAARSYPRYNASAFLLWLLAIAVVGFASWHSAKDYRRAHYKLTHLVAAARQPTRGAEVGMTPTAEPPAAEQEDSPEPAATPDSANTPLPQPLPPQPQQQPNATKPSSAPAAEVEMTASAENGNPPEPAVTSQSTNSPLPPPPPQPDATRPSSAPAAEVEMTATVKNGNPPEPAVTSHSTNSPLPPPPQPDATRPSSAPAAEVEMTATVENENSPEPAATSDSANPPLPEQQPATTASSSAPATATAQQAAQPSIELTVWHAALFIVVASVLLILLFYFQFYTAVIIMYGLGCSGSVAQLLLRPLYGWLAQRLKVHAYLSAKPFSSIARLSELHQVTWLDIVSALSGYAWGAVWLYVWFTSNDPKSQAFYWITQDIFGISLSILFLSFLKLNSIKVATVLLLAVFIYDIFFVFLTPYLFDGDSVMVEVATGGGPSDQVSGDECEKYPDTSECRQGQPLPMLLLIPKIGDFRGGASFLGLGDIVLPGLLTSFAGRLDEARRLVGGTTTLLVDNVPKSYWDGYLFLLLVAYAVGLLMANLAVVWMERGQPALLYIVPACLGTMVAIGYWKGELWELWKGPKVIRWADKLVRYSDQHATLASPNSVFSDADDATVGDTTVGDHSEQDERTTGWA